MGSRFRMPIPILAMISSKVFCIHEIQRGLSPEDPLLLKALACAARHARHGKPPAVRADGNDAMQRNSSLPRMAIARVAGRERKENTMAQKANSLAHTKWMCKHRIVF
jgi:hypothetical protein